MTGQASGEQAVDLQDESEPAAQSIAEETELVRRAQSDPEAFAILYDAHYSRILNFLYRRTFRIAVAEELTSNTFFKALRGLPTYQPRPGVRFRAWLYQIAANELRMHWRNRVNGHQSLVIQACDASRIAIIWPKTELPEESAEKEKRFAMVHEAMGRLSEPYQSVLSLRYFEKLSHDEIAAIMDKPVGTVRSLVHRGLEQMAKILHGIGATI